MEYYVTVPEVWMKTYKVKGVWNEKEAIEAVECLSNICIDPDFDLFLYSHNLDTSLWIVGETQESKDRFLYKGKLNCPICRGTGYYGVTGAECSCVRRA